MVEIALLENFSPLSKPRRVMKYILIYCASGSLTMIIDGNEYELISGDVITITSGQIHHVDKASEAEGFALEFTLDFFCKNDQDIELIFHNGLFCHFGLNEVISIDKGFAETQLNLIKQELEQQPYQYLISVHSHIQLLLVGINRAKIARGDTIWKPDALFLRFLEMVRSNFRHNYSLAQFARILGTTELKLNELAKLHSGKTAQSVIHGLVTAEAKRLLTYSGATVKEVAYQLGYNDPFYFSNFFKKQTNLSPKEYKQKFSL